MKFLVVVALSLASVSAGQYGHGGGHGGHGGGHSAGHGGGHGSGYGHGGHGSGAHGGGYGAPRAYKFSYGVNDPHYGPKFSQSEHNDGKTADGYYSVELPDGRTQHVKYYADQAGYGGYNAEVTYSGYGHGTAGAGKGHGAGY